MNEHQSGEKNVPRLTFFSFGGCFFPIFNELMRAFNVLIQSFGIMLDRVINSTKFPGWLRSSHLDPGALLWRPLTFLGQTLPSSASGATKWTQVQDVGRSGNNRPDKEELKLLTYIK